ncbi:MAG: Na+/H+ antiporter NhaA [Spirochaetota bacterium]
MSQTKQLPKPISILFEYSVFLIVGSLIALIWANVNEHSYHAFIHHALPLKIGHHQLNLHFIVNDIFMVFFFGIAMKEVTEAFLPGGSLSSLSKASLPVIGTLGGVIGPVVVFVVMTMIFKQGPEQKAMLHGWAIPTATDIAYSWLFAKIVFGAVHPAVTFLLVLAVLDDLIGMAIIAVFYSNDVHAKFLGILLIGMAMAFLLRRKGVQNFWPYVIFGGIPAWFGLLFTGVHSSLALVFIVPFMPAKPHDDKLYDASEMETIPDTLNHFEHFFKSPVDIGLFFFGLSNAGVPASSAGMGTAITISAILLGKTFGIFSFSMFGNKVLKMSFPPHTGAKEVFVLGVVAAIGFTVAIFVTGVAFGNPPAHLTSTEELKAIVKQYELEMKMGALLSFASGAIAIFLGKILRVEKVNS